MKAITPPSLPAPFAAYAHGTEVPAGMRWLRSSGQLGMRADGSIPADAEEQADLVFAALATILTQAGMGPQDVVHISGYVTDRADMGAYMRARDRFIGPTDRLPASTLLIVSGFSRPEFRIEAELWAARAP